MVEVVIDVSLQGRMIAYIAADKHKLSQVVRNLLSNALKFSPSPGNVKVHMSTMGCSDGVAGSLEYFVVDVVDSGPGISEVRQRLDMCCDWPTFKLHGQENQDKLFKNIVQFNPGKLQKGGGSGLGLFSKLHRSQITRVF